LRISGIYQDITNGGKTAKALLPFDPDTALWYVINIDLKSQVSAKDKKNEYSKLLPSARVTYVDDYVNQTLGDLIKQVHAIALISIGAALLISILISSMFLKLLVAKHYSQIAIMKAIGFSLKDIQIQYLVKALFVLGLSIVLGTLIANTLGQSLVGLIWSLMGAPQIQFIIDPLQVYFLCPLILMGLVTSVAFMSIVLIKKINIIKMVIE
jgi:putative ABC transport system permease protein